LRKPDCRSAAQEEIDLVVGGSSPCKAAAVSKGFVVGVGRRACLLDANVDAPTLEQLERREPAA
jgi:hypothetical protein